MSLQNAYTMLLQYVHAIRLPYDVDLATINAPDHLKGIINYMMNKGYASGVEGVSTDMPPVGVLLYCTWPAFCGMRALVHDGKQWLSANGHPVPLHVLQDMKWSDELPQLQRNCFIG